jgi:hypothetical protein
MKSILRATLAAAIAAGVFSALLSRLVAKQADAYRQLRVGDRVPTVHPIADAEPAEGVRFAGRAELAALNPH